MNKTIDFDAKFMVKIYGLLKVRLKFPDVVSEVSACKIKFTLKFFPTSSARSFEALEQGEKNIFLQKEKNICGQYIPCGYIKRIYLSPRITILRNNS